MSNFLKDIENLKTFRTFLDVIITRVEKGEKVDFKAISKINDMINEYYKSCSEEQTEEYTVIADDKTEIVKPIDSFLADLLDSKYQPTKKRVVTGSYLQFKKNINYY